MNSLLQRLDKRLSSLWLHISFYRRALKLGMLAVPIIWACSWRHRQPNTYSIEETLFINWPSLRKHKIAVIFNFLPKGYSLIGTMKFLLPRPRAYINYFKDQFFNKDFILSNCTTVYYKGRPAISTCLDGMVALAWICEKMRVNIKIQKPPHAIWDFFNNDTLIHQQDKSTRCLKPTSRQVFKGRIAWFGIFYIPSEYGHKVLSQLSVKEDLIQSANGWFDKHIRGDWVAVHYRGTDVEAEKTTIYKHRYRIDLEPYIEYLQGVLNDKCSIFACSDQAQFIDKMQAAFPGRVFTRKIERSYSNKCLHNLKFIKEVDILKQRRDALIDILILAKAELIYTTGSGFVDVVRYFNPKIKIVSMDSRRIGRGKNNVPMPRKDLFEKLSIPLL